MTVNVADNRYGVAQFIVAPTLAQGANFTTIQSAINAASSGQTIFIRPGSYTENLTLKAGVNICSFNCDAQNGNVNIIGNATFTGAGTVAISGVRLQTNGAALLTVSGSSASFVRLHNCFLNCSNATGISFTSSNAGAGIEIAYCFANIGTTGISLFASSSAGGLALIWSKVTNSGNSTTASTASAGNLLIEFCELNFPISTSSTNIFGATHNNFNPSVQNTTALTIAGNGGSNFCNLNYISSGTATAVTITSPGTCIFTNNTVDCTNATAAISGTGAIAYSGISFTGSGNIITTSTKTGGTLPGSRNSAASAGFLGEIISSFVPSGLAVSLPSGAPGTATNITSINITPGVWRIHGAIQFGGIPGTPVNITCEVTTNSATITIANLGNTAFQIPPNMTPTATSGSTMSIPGSLFTVSANTTVYLVGRGNYASGTLTAYGTLFAERIA